ncbi:MAG: FecCD family ABC transporter permease [Bacteroidaceae bacterium]
MKHSLTIFLLVLLVLVLALCNVWFGSVHIPPHSVWEILTGAQSEVPAAWAYIIRESRVPQAVTALLCGASLSTCGLMLQTSLRNPLAGPSILGIDAGASLGVAVVMLLLGGSLTLGDLSVQGYLLVIMAAMAGALLVMMLLMTLSHILRNAVTLLIAGVVISHLTGSIIQLLNYMGTEEGVHNYVLWGMGNFSSISSDRLPLYCTLLLAGLTCAILLVKPLDALLLGDRYAHSLGVNVGRVRQMLLLVTGLLTATTTAFCGPISFLGLAVPHIARMLLRTSLHRVLLPATMLLGAMLALGCNLLCTLPSEGTVIPVNVITPIIGTPVILYVILRKNRS